jgi:hypothetical protein
MLYSPVEYRGEALASCALMIVPLCLCLVGSLALLGPSIGSIFSNIVRNL